MKNFRALIKKHIDKIILLFLCIVSSMLIVYSNNDVIQFVNKSGHTFFSAFQVGVSGLSGLVSRLFGSIDDANTLNKEIEQLKSLLSDHKRIKQLNSMLEQENNQLRTALDIRYSIPKIFHYNVKEIPALIIAKEPGNFNTSIILNKGSNDGIRKDMTVIAEYEKGFGLVGKIINVSFITSIVIPIYNKDFYGAAQFKNSQYEGLISGLGEKSQNVLMQFVSKNAKSEVIYNDIVITSGTGLVYPKGIEIGSVSEMSSKSYETSMELQIKPVIDFSRLELVYIVAKDNNYLGGNNEESN